MVFSTHLFIFYYLPPFLLLYYSLPFRARTWFIALASYAFYAWSNPVWAGLMFLNSGVDYLCGLALVRMSGLPWEGRLPPIIPEGHPRTRAMRAVLAVSITSNLSLLAFFKYYMFTEENVNAIAAALGGPHLLPYIRVALPVGISFYTFKSMSYAIDVYRGDA